MPTAEQNRDFILRSVREGTANASAQEWYNRYMAGNTQFGDINEDTTAPDEPTLSLLGQDNFITQAPTPDNTYAGVGSDEPEVNTFRDEAWYSNPTTWQGEIDQKNLGMTGLSPEDYRLYRSRLNSLNWNREQGNLDDNEYRNAFVNLTDDMGVPTVVEGTDKVYFMDPGVNSNIYDTNIKGNFGERPGMYRRHAQTEGEGFFGQFDEANTLAPLAASIIAPQFGIGALGTGLLTGGASLAAGNDLRQAALQGLSAGALAGTVPSGTSPLDPNVIMNLTNDAGAYTLGELGGGLVSDILRQQARDQLINPDAPDISWQQPDISDQLGDVQVQVPNFEMPDEGGSSAEGGAEAPEDILGEEDPFGEDPFEDTIGGSGGIENPAGGPGALDEPGDTGDELDYGAILAQFGDQWITNGFDADGNLVTDPSITIRDGQVVDSAGTGENGMSDGLQGMWGSNDIGDSGTGDGTGSGDGDGSGDFDLGLGATGMLGAGVKPEKFMANILSEFELLQRLGISPSSYLANAMRRQQ